MSVVLCAARDDEETFAEGSAANAVVALCNEPLVGSLSLAVAMVMFGTVEGMVVILSGMALIRVVVASVGPTVSWPTTVVPTAPVDLLGISPVVSMASNGATVVSLLVPTAVNESDVVRASDVVTLGVGTTEKPVVLCTALDDEETFVEDSAENAVVRLSLEPLVD